MAQTNVFYAWMLRWAPGEILKLRDSTKRDDQSTYGREGVSCMSFSFALRFDRFIKLTIARHFPMKNYYIRKKKHISFIYLLHHLAIIIISFCYLSATCFCLLVCLYAQAAVKMKEKKKKRKRKKWIRCYIKVLLRIYCWISRARREKESKSNNNNKKNQSL